MPTRGAGFGSVQPLDARFPAIILPDQGRLRGLHVDLEFHAPTVDQVLESQLDEAGLGVTEDLGEPDCALRANRLAALLDVVEMRPRKTELVREGGLRPLLAEPHRLEEAAQRHGAARQSFEKA